MRGLDLGPRQAGTVRRLLEAGGAQLAEVGHEALTVRQVAERAGVSPATAYTYIASKQHLIAQLFLAHLVEQPDADVSGADPVARVQAVTRQLVDSLATEPRLSAGATSALLGSDDGVAELRLEIGAEILRRFSTALGPGTDPTVVEALVLAFTGALLQVGMDLLTYPAMRERMDAVVATILRGNA
ncbi:TetR/AcrR family transcriptional regulator [Nocardioides ultimimeridianus]